jgi:hypothetical protein
MQAVNARPVAEVARLFPPSPNRSAVAFRLTYMAPTNAVGSNRAIPVLIYILFGLPIEYVFAFSKPCRQVLAVSISGFRGVTRRPVAYLRVPHWCSTDRTFPLCTPSAQRLCCFLDEWNMFQYTWYHLNGNSNQPAGVRLRPVYLYSRPS